MRLKQFYMKKFNYHSLMDKLDPRKVVLNRATKMKTNAWIAFKTNCFDQFSICSFPETF